MTGTMTMISKPLQLHNKCEDANVIRRMKVLLKVGCKLMESSADTQRILRNMKRTAAENAYTTLEDGVYTVHAEVPGTELNEQTVLDGLRAAVSVLGVTADGPQDTAFELTSVDCYKQPEITTATLRDTPDSLFRKALADLEIKVTFNADTAQYLPHGEETLTSHDLASIVDMEPDGTVTVDEKVLREKVSKWVESYNKKDAPFLFDSWVKGLTEIDFVTCDYQIDAQSLAEQIRAQLLTMQSGTVSAEAVCYDKDGKPFAFTDAFTRVGIVQSVLDLF